jgi:TonB-linked SusC/RagA family outer membrane protein
LKDPFRTGLRQEYNVSVSSGNESNNMYASLSYLDEEGYVVNSDFNRISARITTEQKVGEYVKIGGGINYVRTDMNNIAASTTSYSNMFMFGQQIAPIYPIYIYNLDTGEPILDTKGNKQYDFGETYARPYAAQQNPLATAEAGENKTLVDIMSSRGSFEVNFLKDFKFTTNISYDMFTTSTVEFMTPIGGDAYNVQGRGERTTTRYSAMNINQLLNYNKKFDLHTVDVLLGHENKKDNRSYLYGHMTNFVDPGNSEFSNAAKYQNLTSSYTEYALEGYFSRIEYNYDEKYYLTTSLRRDASSRFHPDVRWGTFWALGGSWRISKERFLEDYSFIRDLKLRISYGTQGNDNLIDTDKLPIWYGYRNLYAVNRVDGEGAMSWIFRGNPKLTWEKSNNFNTGFELLAWDERLSFTFDYFIKETKDLLYQRPKAASEGLPSFQWVNDIDMKNTGVEFDLGIDLVHTNDFKWNVSMNATHYKNKLTKLPTDKQPLIEKDGGYQAGSYWRKIGGTIFDFYTYEYVGVDPETGLAQYNQYIKNDDGSETVEKVNKTTEATLRATGKSAIPDLYGGFGTSFEFKGFDLSAHTAFQLGGYVMDDSYMSFMNPGNSGQNFHKDMFRRWTPENPQTDVPKLLFEDQDQAGVSDRWLTKASYFSIRNITLGYTLSKRVANMLKVERLRIYGVVDNLWYVSERKGLDTRQTFTGTVSYAYSPLRTISFGVSASF